MHHKILAMTFSLMRAESQTLKHPGGLAPRPSLAMGLTTSDSHKNIGGVKKVN